MWGLIFANGITRVSKIEGLSNLERMFCKTAILRGPIQCSWTITVSLSCAGRLGPAWRRSLRWQYKAAKKPEMPPTTSPIKRNTITETHIGAEPISVSVPEQCCSRLHLHHKDRRYAWQQIWISFGTILAALYLDVAVGELLLALDNTHDRPFTCSGRIEICNLSKLWLYICAESYLQ